MKCLGFKYEVRRKIYYVDGHEKPVTELNDLEEELEIKVGNGHRYTDPQTSIEMVELHVDAHPSFHEKMNATTIFGGNLSVRMPPNTKPLIGFGQDECIFKQYLFSSKAWTTPDGQKPVIPKDEGLGVMLSAFVSREFGFGMKLTVEDLRQVNEYRQGKHICCRIRIRYKYRGVLDLRPHGLANGRLCRRRYGSLS
jgi:hypothetical protein